MKFIVIPDKIKDINDYDNDTFIVGLKNYSINYPEATLEEIKKLSNKKDIFVSINKNIFNSELEELKNILLVLESTKIKGILFYDLGLLNIVIDNNIKLNLVWHQTHMVTNYNTCNYYYEKGVEYAYLANEITLDEIVEISNKSKIKLMVEMFGYPIMSHSRRSLITNYFKSINETKEDRDYILSDNENSYITKESNNGTSILFGKLINGTKPLFELVKSNIEYLVLDMQKVEKDIGFKVLDKFKYIKDNIGSIDEEEKEKIIDYMNNLIGDSTNFFYKKTVYKVKKGDK